MGNVLCCCKGRNKDFEEGKQGEGNIGSLPGKNYFSKPNQIATPTPSFDESDNLTSASSTATKKIDKYPTKQAENESKALSNFSTFAGDKDLRIFDEDFTSNAIKPKQKVTETHSASKYYIRLYIDYIDICYKLCDDFGAVFKPYLEVAVGNGDSVKVSSSDEDKLNSSAISDIDLNNSMNNSIIRSGGNICNTSTIGKEKTIYFKSSHNFEINSNCYFSSLQFDLKNDTPITSKVEAPPSITIGDAKMSINLLYHKYKDNSFDDYIEIRLRNNLLIGYLKVNVIISDKALTNQDDFYKKFNKGKFLEEVDSDIFNNLDTYKISTKSIKVWDNTLNIEDIDPQTVSLFIGEYESRDTELRRGAQVPRNCDDYIDSSVLFKLYMENMSEDGRNLIALYQFLILLVKLTKKQEFVVIDEFFKMLSEEQRKSIDSIPCRYVENPYIVKTYLVFLFNYQVYFKNSKSIVIRNNRSLDDKQIIKTMVETISRLTVLLKNDIKTYELELETRDCILWCLNNLNELINQAPDLTIVPKEEAIAQKKNEYLVNQSFNFLEHLSELHGDYSKAYIHPEAY